MKYADIKIYIQKKLLSILFSFSFITKNFFSKERTKTILITEVNPCHAEVLLGIKKYLESFEYRTEFLLNDEIYNQDPFCRVNKDELIVNYLPYKVLVTVLKSRFVQKFDYIFICSSFDYIKDEIFCDFYKLSNSPKNGFLFLEHDKKNLNNLSDFYSKQYSEGRICFLGKKGSYDYLRECPCFFFGSIDKRAKNKKVVVFLVAGAGSRNIKKYIIIVENLLRKGIRNFRFDITGCNEASELHEYIVSKDLTRWFTIMKRVTYKQLYSVVENADFLIAPDNYGYYQNRRVSGSRQLSFGFYKPLIIMDFICDEWGLSSDTCVTYVDSLFEGIWQAYSMDVDAYKSMQDLIKTLANKFYLSGLNEMRVLLQNRTIN